MRYQWKDLFIFVTYFVLIPQLAFGNGKCGNEKKTLPENQISKYSPQQYKSQNILEH